MTNLSKCTVFLQTTNVHKFKKIVPETVRVLEVEWSSGEGEVLPVDIADDITKCYSKGLKL